MTITHHNRFPISVLSWIVILSITQNLTDKLSNHWKQEAGQWHYLQSLTDGWICSHIRRLIDQALVAFIVTFINGGVTHSHANLVDLQNWHYTHLQYTVCRCRPSIKLKHPTNELLLCWKNPYEIIINNVNGQRFIEQTNIINTFQKNKNCWKKSLKK